MGHSCVKRRSDFVMVTDTEIIGLIESGYCVVADSVLVEGLWQIMWRCHYHGDRVAFGPSLREAVNNAVIEGEQALH